MIKKFEKAYRNLTMIILASAILFAVGYGFIATYDFLPMFLMILLLIPFVLGCSTMIIIVIVEQHQNQIKNVEEVGG